MTAVETRHGALTVGPLRGGWLVVHDDGRRWYVTYDQNLGSLAMPDRFRWTVYVGRPSGRRVKRDGAVHRNAVSAVRAHRRNSGEGIAS